MTQRFFAARICRFFGEHWPVSHLRNLQDNKLRGSSSRDQVIHPFDITHRVDTSGLFYAPDLPSGPAHDQHSAGYYATAPSLFTGSIALWSAALPSAGLSLNDFTLLDIGCGKGRIVLLASEHPFRAIVGVELNHHLARITTRNLKIWMRKPLACRKIEIVNHDIFSVDLPDGPVVLYFFNSFERELVQMLLDKLVAISTSRSDPIDLIYIHPEFDHLVRQTPHIKLLSDEVIPFTTEDAAADAFSVDCDRCCVYRLDGMLK
jgi:SAM-dependent methyltransferase